MSFWHEAVPFLIQQYPWAIPVIALLFPLAAVGKGFATAIDAWQKGLQQDFDRDSQRYQQLLDQRNMFEALYRAEAKAHAECRACLAQHTVDKQLPPPL